MSTVREEIKEVMKEIVQCCEHLNRAIVLEKEAAEKYGFEIVNVIPQPHAGGAFAANITAA